MIESAAGAAPSAPQPWLDVTPLVALRVSAATMLIAMGMHYLVSGRKEASLDKMINGAVLCLMSLLAFAL